MSLCSHAISAQATVGEGTKFIHHGLGTVIHQRTVIGKNCTVFQNVTVGIKNSMKDEKGVPVIGDNVTIGAGSVLLGNIYIGDNAVIGANAVVLKDIPAGAMAVGVPAKYVLLQDEKEG